MMRLIIVLVAFYYCCSIGQCKSATLHQVSRCSAGATYWCSSAETAMQCNAVDYCQVFAWRASNNEQLELQQPFHCLYITRQVKRLLNLNFTKKFIIEQSRRICNILPGQSREVCQVITQNYFMSIIELLHVGATTEQICYEAKISKTLAQSVLPIVPSFPGSKNATLCGYCEYFVTVVEALFERKGELENLIQVLVDRACESLTDAAQKLCIDFIRNYMPGIIKTIEKLPPRTICRLLVNTCKDSEARAYTQFSNEINTLMPNKCDLGPIYGCINKHTSETCNMNKQCHPLINL
ncbi:Prosaposin [Trichoplax sp. H2]|nr:Prosaposin [Trichoplax sp. H2]|eukprot:RDD45233.1 Prosaposin [Trichoplax sp. H2]